MIVFEAVKQNLTTRQAAEMYGILPAVFSNWINTVLPIHPPQNKATDALCYTNRLIQSPYYDV